MNFMKRASTSTLALALCVAAFGQATIDGTKDSSYGSALALQTIGTSFGNANGSGVGGSELDGAYAQIHGGTLDLMLTGDLEQNGNHLDVWFSTGAAGQNQLSGLSNSAGSDNVSNWNGATLSSGFMADYGIIFSDNGGTPAVYLESYNGTSWTETAAPSSIQAAVNNSNVGQTSSASGVALASGYAAGVNTGMEFGIALSALGMPTGNINVIAAINGGHDDYLSNQFLGGLPVGTGSLGDNGSGTYQKGSLANINLQNFGNPMFTIPQAAPEPFSIATLGLGAIALIRRRRAN